jgi:hypothetical protein
MQEWRQWVAIFTVYEPDLTHNLPFQNKRRFRKSTWDLLIVLVIFVKISIFVEKSVLNSSQSNENVCILQII